MDARIERLDGRHLRDRFLGKVLGMRRYKSEPLQSGKRAYDAAEVAKIGARCRVLPCVHGLTDEHHLASAGFDFRAYVVDDIAQRPMVETPADVRHDAERTVIRTAALDVDERAQM